MGPVVPERARGSRTGQARGRISYQARAVTAELMESGFTPLDSDGTINICRTSALLHPAVQGQGEVVASLTHVPSSCRATGKRSITHSGQKKPKRALSSSCYPSPPTPHPPPAAAVPPPSTSLTSAASPFPTSFPSATLHPKFYPLRVHILGDRGCFQYLGVADQSWDAQT